LRIVMGVRSGVPARRPRPSKRRRRRDHAITALAAVASFTAPLALMETTTASAAQTAAAASAATSSTSIVLVGHGYGHGIGMGQWGSLGYALGDDGGAGNYTYGQILSHFYGGTTLSTLGTAPAPASLHGGDVVVAMTENSGDDLIATAASGTLSVAGVTTTATAVLFHLVGPGSIYDVYVSGGCAGQGGWQPAAAGTNVSTPTAVATNAGPVELCQPGASIELHGSLSAVADSDEQAQTVNTLPLDLYVADVAPAESSSSWAQLGGAGPQGEDWGFQQSEAQTVAVRSYVEANPLGYDGYADTCDQTCQSYPGMKDETPVSLLAAQDTAGQVMVTDGTSTVATTEYSASSGGYSTGALFPSVVDAGDAVCVSASVCNPNHDWTDTVSDTSISTAYPAIGSFSSLDVTSRNGEGDFGGRVNQLTLTGTEGSVTVTGSAFASALGLKSDWFTLADQPSGGTAGYWMDASDGGVFSFGAATFEGSAGALRLKKPIVGMAPTPDGGGYWLVAADGGIFTYGDATFYGSTGALTLNKPVVGMAPTPDGHGYWLVAADGGIFTYGDATYYGSTGALTLNKPIVGMVPTHDGGGYWLVASDGGIFSFGDATFVGSLGGAPPASPVVAMAPSAGGAGYWMLEADGTVAAFGNAPTVAPAAGSPVLSSATAAMTSLAPTADGQGYVMVDGTGQAFSFGDAPYFGDVASAVPGYAGGVVGIAATPG
jgi:peptidoglycan hydrolase-like amidase